MLRMQQNNEKKSNKVQILRQFLRVIFKTKSYTVKQRFTLVYRTDNRQLTPSAEREEHLGTPHYRVRHLASHIGFRDGRRRSSVRNTHFLRNGGLRNSRYSSMQIKIITTGVRGNGTNGCPSGTQLIWGFLQSREDCRVAFLPAAVSSKIKKHGRSGTAWMRWIPGIIGWQKGHSRDCTFSQLGAFLKLTGDRSRTFDCIIWRFFFAKIND